MKLTTKGRYAVLALTELALAKEDSLIKITEIAVRQNISSTYLEQILLLLKNSDFISLHCDLNSTSFHLISNKELKMMKSGTIIINTCRGEVIDQPALENALEKKIIFGAALDVFETEPLPNNSKLRKLDNVFLSPHNSNASPSVFNKVDKLSIQNLFSGIVSN